MGELSSPNDCQKLQNVADDLLKVQRLADLALEAEQKPGKSLLASALSNITNTIEVNSLAKR